MYCSRWTLGDFSLRENDCVFAEKFASQQCGLEILSKYISKRLSIILWKDEGRGNQRTWVVMKVMIFLTAEGSNVKLDYYNKITCRKRYESVRWQLLFCCRIVLRKNCYNKYNRKIISESSTMEHNIVV